MPQRALLASLLVWFALLLSVSANAHLMPVGRGTINVVHNKAYLVLSLPVAAFASDTFQQESLTSAQLKSAESSLRRRVREGITLSSNGEQASIEKVLLSLQAVDHHHHDERGEHMMVMLVARFERPPAALALRSDLWADGVSALHIKATVTKAGEVKRAETGELSSRQPAFVFFATSGQVLAKSFQLGVLHLLTGADHVLFIALILLLGIERRRWIKIMLGLAAAFAVASWVHYRAELVPSQWLEVAIAASVVAAAAAFIAPKRVASLELSFATGLGILHGLGFASTAGPAGHHQHLPWVKILGLNLAAGAGLLLVALGVAAVVRLGKRTLGEPFQQRLMRGAPLLAGLAGLYWVAARAASIVRVAL